MPDTKSQTYQAWLKKYGLQETSDYDTRAAFTSGIKPDARGHLPDTFKRPNHITYSTGSIYSDKGPTAGRWEGNDKDGWTFYASKTNINNAGGADKLQDYFNRQEPDAKLVLPPIESRDKGTLASLRNINQLREQSSDIGNQFFEKSTEHNGPADAMRHIIFNAKLTAGTGSRVIPWLLDKIHEYGETYLTGQPKKEMEMDLANGEIGRAIGKLNLTDAEMVDLAQRAVQGGKAATLSQNEQQQKYAAGGAVSKLTKMAKKMEDLAEGVKAAKKTEMFIGPKSTAWDAGSNALAIKMEDEGASPRTIWEQTMNWRTPEGKWAQEISDKDVEYDPTAMLANAKAKYKQQVGEFEARRNNYEQAWALKNMYDRLVRETPHDQFYVKDEHGKTVYSVTGKPVLKEGAEDQIYALHQELKKQAIDQYGKQTKVLGAPVSPVIEDLFRNTPEWRLMYEAQRKPSAEGLIRPSATTVRDLPMKDAITATELFANYPRLAGHSFNVHTPRQMGIADASFNPYSGYIKLSSGSLTPESSLLHELQHGVQQIEGWEGGTSPSAFNTGRPEIAKQLYLRNLGETMARATEARQNLSIPQRNALFPEDSFTLPMVQPSKVMDQMMWQGMPAEKKALIRKYVDDNIMELSGAHRRNRSFESSSIPLAYDPEKVQSIVDDLKSDVETPPQKFAIGGAVGKLTKMERALARMEEGLSPIAKGETNIIKDKGGNWLSGSNVNNFLTVPEDVATTLQHAGNPEPLNDWIDKKLVRYIKNDMGTAEDEVRKLFDQGITHTTELDDSLARNPVVLSRIRQNAGKPVEGVATTELGKKWEVAADNQIFPIKAGALLDPASAYEKAELKDTLQNNPWLTKVPPETPTYQLGPSSHIRGADPLGFRHLVDELRNATVENSTLPEHLRLDPKKLDKVTLPQAVQLVDKINKWREANKAEANLAIANNPATVLHKEYPEEGFKWVELKMPKMDLPATATRTVRDNTEGMHVPELGFFSAPRGRFENGVWVSEPNWYDAEDRAKQAYSKKLLQDALTYEGDTMGHCVGGYCGPVAAGETQIFSLRDKKGEPHVTIETAPGYVDPEEFFQAYSTLYPQGTLFDEDELGSTSRWRQDWKDSVMESPEYIEYAKKEVPPSIVQIKGKGNKMPADKYIPFVQDFIKSRDWQRIDELENAKMHTLDRDPYDDLGMGLMQLRERMREAGVKQNQKYYTEDELNDLFKQHGIKTEGYAKGGAVRRLAAVAASCGCKKAEGGPVNFPNPDTPDQKYADTMGQEYADANVVGYANGGLVAPTAQMSYDPTRVQSIADQLRQDMYNG